MVFPFLITINIILFFSVNSDTPAFNISQEVLTNQSNSCSSTWTLASDTADTMETAAGDDDSYFTSDASYESLTFDFSAELNVAYVEQYSGTECPVILVRSTWNNE